MMLVFLFIARYKGDILFLPNSISILFSDYGPVRRNSIKCDRNNFTTECYRFVHLRTFKYLCLNVRKHTFWHVHPVTTHISLHICIARMKKPCILGNPKCTDQTVWMCRQIWIFLRGGHVWTLQLIYCYPNVFQKKYHPSNSGSYNNCHPILLNSLDTWVAVWGKSTKKYFASLVSQTVPSDNLVKTAWMGGLIGNFCWMHIWRSIWW